MKVVVLALVFLSPGCAWRVTTTPLPARPILPEVRYVPPSDPQAVAGLTADAIEALRKRDLLLQKHIERLEWQLRNQ